MDFLILILGILIISLKYMDNYNYKYENLSLLTPYAMKNGLFGITVGNQQL